MLVTPARLVPGSGWGPWAASPHPVSWLLGALCLAGQVCDAGRQAGQSMEGPDLINALSSKVSLLQQGQGLGPAE